VEKEKQKIRYVWKYFQRIIQSLPLPVNETAVGSVSLDMTIPTRMIGCLFLLFSFSLILGGACTFERVDDEIIGKSCDFNIGCETGYRCDPVWQEGVIEGGVCLYDQGALCNPDYNLCGRGLGCRLLEPKADEEIASDPSARKYQCLPEGCLLDSECSTGKICRNMQCVSEGCAR